jgi:NADH-quinone oxidoreductase subunit A
MDGTTANVPVLWPLVVFFVAIVVQVCGIIVLSWLLGQRHHDRATGEPYESGILPTGSAHLRLSVNFYLVAVFFAIFDLESSFLFAWALCVRQAGWTGYLESLIFIGILMAALAYLWREGALDWGTGQR